jgi:hypothetical protein
VLREAKAKLLKLFKRRPRVSRSLIAREFDALLRFLQEQHCTFHGCLALGEAPVPRGISFRYDVHLRDLPAAPHFMELHLGAAIPATFFLLWDFSPDERRYFNEFRTLAQMARGCVEIGLHDSPVDAWLIESKFNNDRPAYVRWMRTSDAPEWFATFADDPAALETLHRDTLERFVARVERTKDLFGPIASVASHGGQIGRLLRREKHQDLACIPVLRSLEARGWLTTDRVRAAGLMADVESYRWGENRTQVSDGGGKIANLAHDLKQALAEDRAVQILLHPYTWDGAPRDADLRDALANAAAPNEKS